MIWVDQVTLFVDGSIRWSRPPPVEYTAVPSEARMSGHSSLIRAWTLPVDGSIRSSSWLGWMPTHSDPAATAMLTAADPSDRSSVSQYSWTRCPVAISVPAIRAAVGSANQIVPRSIATGPPLANGNGIDLMVSWVCGSIRCIASVSGLDSQIDPSTNAPSPYGVSVLRWSVTAPVVGST